MSLRAAIPDVLREIVPYLVFVALVAGAIFWFRPDEDRLPTRTEVSWPKAEVRGLTVPGDASRPGFRADAATPREKSGVITLGGWKEGLDLRGIVVELEPGCVLEASSGRYVEELLTLEGDVRVTRDGRRCLDARRVELHGNRVRFVGLVVLYPTGRRTTAMDLELTRAVLLSRLR